MESDRNLLDQARRKPFMLKMDMCNILHNELFFSATVKKCVRVAVL